MNLSGNCAGIDSSLAQLEQVCDRSRLRDGFYCYYSGLRFRAEVVCRPKLRTSFSSDDNRVAKSLRPRFARLLWRADKWQDANRDQQTDDHED